MSGLDSLEMNRQALELLGALPFFDLDLGADVVGLIARNLEGKSLDVWAGQYVFDLAASGLLEDVKGLLRVPQPQRARFAGDDWIERDGLIAQALERFEERANVDLRSRLNRILGARSAQLLIQSVRVAAGLGGGGSFDQLIDTVHESERLGRFTDAENAAATLRRYLAAEDRRLVFLQALAQWQVGDKSAASNGFERVLETKTDDKAEGIAAHLLATYRHERGIGLDAETIDLLTRAEAALESVNDHWGLSLTHSTHGRVLRDHAKRTIPSDDEPLAQSLVEYSRAEQALGEVYADDMPDRARSLARIRMGQAETLSDRGDLPGAINIAEAVLDTLPDHADEKLYCRTLLARLYRDSHRIGDAFDVLSGDVIRRVRTTRRADLEVARALNVLATVQRNSGDLVGAQRSAEESVALGEALGSHRHIAHAGVTLATIKVDRLPPQPTEADVMAIRSLLYKAREHGAHINELLAQLPAKREALKRTTQAEDIAEPPDGQASGHEA